jgi:uncharacterized protein (TIRG00374 family)
MNRRVFLRLFAGIAGSVVAILLVAQAADIPAAIARIAAVDPRWLVLPALVIIAQMWVRAVRWAIILSAVQPVPISGRTAMWPTIAGYLGNIALPARLGEVIRIVLISRRTPVTATAATASVVIERAVDLLALLAFAAAAYGVIGAVGWLPFLAMMVLLGVFGVALRTTGWLAARVPARVPARVRDVLVRLLQAFGATGPSAVLRAWLVSVVAWLLDALVLYLCAQALGVTVSPGAAILISAGGALGAALPAAAAAFGTYELGAVAVSGLVGIPADDALQVALLGHIVGVVTIVGMGVVGIVSTTIFSDGTASGDREAVLPGPGSEPRP